MVIRIKKLNADTIENDDLLSVLLVMVVSIPLFTNFLGSILHSFGISTIFSTIIIYGTVTICEYYWLAKRNLNVLQSCFIDQIIIITLLICNYLFFEKSRIYFRNNILEISLIVLTYFPMGVGMTRITNYKYFFERLGKIVVLTPIAGLLSYYVFNISALMNYMVFSMMILPGTLACGYHLFYGDRRKRLKYIICFTIDLFLMIVYGGRMSLIAVIVYLLLLIYSRIRKASLEFQIPIWIGSVALAAVVYFGAEVLTNLLISAITPYRQYSRIIDTIVRGKFFSSNEVGGRVFIYSYARDYLKKMGLTINGFFGDRIILLDYMPSGGYKTGYVHNIFYELLLSFGWILGGLSSIVLIIKTLQGIFSKNDTKSSIVMYFFCLEFLRLLVSGSFLIEGTAFLFLCSLFIKTKDNRGAEYENA